MCFFLSYELLACRQAGEFCFVKLFGFTEYQMTREVSIGVFFSFFVKHWILPWNRHIWVCFTVTLTNGRFGSKIEH
jgi:hypothetical protein